MKLYKVFSTVATLLGGILAGKLFQRLWKGVSRQDDAPQPTDEERPWKEVLAASAAQGAMAGVVRAAVARGGAAGMRRATGNWPG
ncbi:DUF4235 domain-containing protein [Streptomyces sp. JJ36]|uniref:DUF4235 domain-containing protein n=1 Tax=Streptomyces sp. JJ36 TaxID=2736645 RepID=UPI001F256FD3|nr:DUF4235 domain-containing protein [Streptomyces sp. JJ36]